MPRRNKSKKEVVSEIQLVQKADRRRALVRDVIFPYLLKMDDTVGYSNIFLQTFGAFIDGAFDKLRATTTIGSMTPELKSKLDDMFNLKKEEHRKEHDRYMELVKLLRDVSVEDLPYATELHRYIDSYIVKSQSKLPIKDIPIEEILG